MQKNVIEGYRLSPQQEHLWLLQEPGSCTAYRSQCAILIEGDLDVDILRMALQTVIGRHEILRTTYRRLAEMVLPLQVVTDDAVFDLPVQDLSHLGPQQQRQSVQALFDAGRSLPIDFEMGPLFYVSLFILTPQEHVLFVKLPALCADTASLTNLVNEIAQAYAARLGNEDPLGEVMQYADISEWQNEMLEAKETASGREFWRKQAAPAWFSMKLPFESQPGDNFVFKPEFLATTIDAATTSGIEALAARYDTTAAIVLNACWRILLCRLSGLSDSVVGVAFDGRGDEDLQGAIGVLAKYLPVSCLLEEGLRFSQVLQQVIDATEEANKWQECFSWGQLDAHGDSGRAFLPYCFDFDKRPGVAKVSGINFSISNRYSCVDRFKARLSFIKTSDSLIAELHYDPAFFQTESVERFLAGLHVLIGSVIKEPEASVGMFDILDESTRLQLLVTLNDTGAEYPRQKCLHELFEQQVERSPDNIAVVFKDQQLTYAELDARANRLARSLLRMGVGPDVLVGLLAERSAEMVVGILAILKAGGAYLPLDPSYPSGRSRLILEDAQVSVLLTQRRLAESLAPRVSRIVLLDSDPDSEQAPGQGDDAATTGKVCPDNLAYVIYTSGSTGNPKGVMITHRGLVNYLCWCAQSYTVTEGEGSIVHSSIGFDLTVTSLFPPLLMGRSITLLPESFGVDALSYALRGSKNLSLVKLTPAHLQMLSQALAPEEVSAMTRAFVIGGESLHAESLSFWRTHSPATRLINEYGPTETAVGCCVYQAEEINSGPVPIGRPIANTHIYVLNSHLQPVPVGVEGELYIGGDGLARGYLNTPGLTAEKFIPNPFGHKPGERIYKTGDIARHLPDGNIEFIGRADDQVKIRGFRVELGEIEAALRQHPAVRDAAVILREDSPGAKRLTAYIAPASAGREAESDGNNELALVGDPASHSARGLIAGVRTFLKDRLPAYMIPPAIVLLDRLPLTSNGKVDRRALPAPDESSPETEGLSTSDYDPIEEILSGIWANVLGVAEVGRDDNFFAMGGHSLSATQVISSVREKLRVELPVRTLFEKPTIAALSEEISNERLQETVETPPVTRTPRDVRPPLSFAQQRLWLTQKLDPTNIAYNVPGAIRLKGPLDIAALERSLSEIVRRHEILRTALELIDGEPVQVIRPAAALKLPITDLTDWLEEIREDEAIRLVLEEAHRPFDLTVGPLLRVGLLRLGADDHVLLIVMHHLIIDGWSGDVLARELDILYSSFSRGELSPLPELAVQYADFAIWQRKVLQGGRLERQLNFWKEQLRGAPAVLELPTDRPRPATATHHGARERLAIPAELAHALKALSRQEGATLFMTLLAAFQVLLSRYSGQTDIVIGTSIAGRTRAETEPLIGMFFNMLALRTDLSGNPSFRQLLERVRETTLSAYAHQDLPFDQLVAELAVERNLSYSLIFQVLFELQNAPAVPAVLEGLQMERMEIKGTTAKYNLTLSMIETPRELRGVIEYSTDLFDATTIRRMIGHYCRVLGGIAANADRKILELPLMTVAEHEQIVVEWNATAVAYSDEKCMHELFEHQTEKTPGNVALVYEAQQLSYEELNRRANQVAHYLRKLGVGPEVRVGICMERSLEMVIGLFGILKAGGAYVAVDPAYPADRVAYMLEDCGASVLLTQERLLEKLPNSISAEVVCLDARWNRVAREAESAPERKAAADNLAYIYYTSGSTGRPKGVAMAHYGICNYIRWGVKAYGATMGNGAPVHSSMAVDLTLTNFLPLFTGKPVVMVPEMAGVEGLFRLIQNNPDWGLLKITPTHLALLNPQLQSEQMAKSTRVLVIGADNLVADPTLIWRDKVPGVILFNEYGPTETVVGCSLYYIDEDTPRVGPVPIGKPIWNITMYVLDESMQPVPIGVSGELYIGGIGVARGYWGRADLTAEKFVPDCFSDMAGARMYRTGDRARYLSDGNIEFMGRLDFQVKIRGFRIELGEIEAVLSGHPRVSKVMVVVHEEEAGDKQMVAYAAVEKDTTAAELRNYMKERLPEYMVPASFVVMDELPVLPSGKIDRKALPKPQGVRPDRPFVSPRDSVELQLALIWENVLNISPVGVTDNFFELGGQSLRAVRLMADIHKLYGIDVPLAALFQEGTIEHLASLIQKESGPVLFSPLVTMQPRGSNPPFFAPHSGGGHVVSYIPLARRLAPDQPFYGFQAPFFDGQCEPYTSLEEMAADYIKVMRAHQPEGPYFLGGLSFGGLVSFEMAQQLVRQGEQVALLALLDTASPLMMKRSKVEENDLPAMLAVMIREEGRKHGKYISVRAEDIRAIDPDERLNYFVTRLREVNPIVDIPQVRRALEAFMINLRLGQSYVPKVYPGPITLLRAADADWEDAEDLRDLIDVGLRDRDMALGWGALSTKPVEVHVIPGYHVTMTLEPNAQVLADLLRKCITSARAKNLKAKGAEL